MAFPHLFEFMDLQWLPQSLRHTLREILACGNGPPFRPHYSWVADRVLSTAREEGLDTIVELGAGTAPITRHMVADQRAEGLRFIVCDNNPDLEAYESLQREYPDKVIAKHEPVNFTEPQLWRPRTLLILSATLHHVPSNERPRVFANLADAGQKVMVFEPLRKSFLSVLFVFLSIVPAILLPILYIRQPGRFRRIFWCWLFPLAPIMFWWDGIVSCLRMWTEKEWQEYLAQLANKGRRPIIRHSLFCQEVDL